MDRKILRGSMLLMLGALIWGCAFVAQNVGMDYVGPFTFNGARSFIGTLTLLPFVLIRDQKERRAHPERTPAEQAKRSRLQLIAGIIGGVALFLPTTLQQIGLTETSAGKSGFITAMYIVVVPIFGLFLGQRAGLRTWLCVAISIVGLYLLCVTERFTIGLGDTVTLVSVIFWGVQILIVDYFASRVDCVAMVCTAFLVTGLLSAAPALIFEEISAAALRECLIPLLYTGVMSSGIAYTLQAVGQRDTPPALAAIIMSLESVFAALAGYVLLHDRFTERETLGCVLMFTAVILAQLPHRKQHNGCHTEVDGAARSVVNKITP